MEIPTQIFIVSLLVLQIVKFELNYIVGKQFYPGRKRFAPPNNYTKPRHPLPPNGEKGEYIERHDHLTPSHFLYSWYTMILIPYWIRVPKTRVGKNAAHAVLLTSVIQILVIIFLMIRPHLVS